MRIHRAWGPATVLVLLLAIVGSPALATASDGGARGAGSDAMPLACKRPTRSVTIADRLLDNRYQLGSFPTVTLPEDLTWRENPLGENNWLVRFHGLTWLWPLVAAWRTTGDERYALRVRQVIDDQLASNPRSDPASRWAWYNQAAGRRATVLACVKQELGGWPKLNAGLARHAEALSDPDFYVWSGNHALDQAIGLLDVGHVLGDDDWVDLARQRIGALVRDSVSPTGVTNEQAVGYQYYNHRRYVEAAARFAAYGLGEMPYLDRVERMPSFLAHAILPNGQYETIGDTEAEAAPVIPGTVAEFAATAGASGPRPRSRFGFYRDDGWWFARTGWGASRPFQDEVHASLRFGTGPRFHGHHDLGSVTLYGYGSRLIVDPGKYSYNSSRLRSWITGRSAHNVVTVSGVDLERVPAALRSYRQTKRLADTVVQVAAGPALTWERRVLFSVRLGYLVVEDRLVSDTSRRFRQLWHLREDARPMIEGDRIRTRRVRGNVVIVNLAGGDPTIVTGRTSPMQGWLSYRYGSILEAPVVEVRKEGTTARYVTLVVPGARKVRPIITDTAITEDGFTFTVTLRGRTEQVTVADGIATIEDGSPAPG